MWYTGGSDSQGTGGGGSNEHWRQASLVESSKQAVKITALAHSILTFLYKIVLYFYTFLWTFTYITQHNAKDCTWNTTFSQILQGTENT